MGKPKKKGRPDDDWEDDVATEIDSLALDKVDQPEDIPITKKKDKKKKGKKAEVEEDDSADNDNGTDVSNKTAKHGMVSAFQMLSMDSDDDQESPPSSDREESSPKPVINNEKKKQKPAAKVAEENQGPEAAQSKGKDKKGKSDKKEEDIDALLAEIEGPKQDAAKGKKKKKGKDLENESQGENTSEEPAGGDTQHGLEGKDPSLMTEDEIAAWLDAEFEEDDRKKKKKNKKAKKLDAAAEEQDKAEVGDQEEQTADGESTVKTAAQKKKEKKERQKQQKLQEKAKGKSTSSSEGKKEAEETSSVVIAELTATTDQAAPDTPSEPADGGGDVEEEKDGDKKKKKDRRKKKKGEAEEEEAKKKKPSKLAKGILEVQKRMKEEQERLEQEELEKERLLEEKRKQKEEQEAHERERKEREKQKKKEKIERQKAEGTYLTAKQKQERQRQLQMLEDLKARGIPLPQPTEKKKKPVYERKKKKKSDQNQEIQDTTPTDSAGQTPQDEVDVTGDWALREEPQEEPHEDKAVTVNDQPVQVDDVKDEWDAESEDEETEESKSEKIAREDDEDEEEEESEESDSEEESEESSSETESEEEEDDGKMTSRDRALARIAKRKEDAEKSRSISQLRAPVVCVLGHVDTGKTKILDKLRRTHVQDDEAGGITQQIGATNVPLHAIREQTKMCKEFSKQELRVPGLLIIDTPGHESFSNLRTRGSSLCDISILVIDIMHGLEPQTIESINLLKKGKTPFIVALNKIDRLYQWQSNPHTDIVNTLKKQKLNTRQEFDQRAQMVIVQLAEQGLNACLFHENKNVREYISLVPTSAHTGDGLGNLMALICEFSQTLLAKRISFSEGLQATVMEVKAIQGLGTTIDVILVNGRLYESETVIVAGQEGPIVTQIRAVLMPQPMKELRVKNAYTKHKEIMAAQGCKIIAKDLEKALAGLPLYVAKKADEVEVYKDEISEALENILGSIKLQERGVYVQASTLGSLEALLEFLRTSTIPYAGINIGPVHKKDIMKASIMLEHDSQWAVILAFDVKIERDAQEMADSVGVTIFSAEIIYHLFDKFTAHREDLKKKKQDQFKHVAVFPCQLRILPQFVFNSRDPIVCGVNVVSGFLKEGTPICVPTKEFLDIGRVTSLELNHKQCSKATKGQEVCIKIEPIPGEAPKLFGRHFDENDLLVSKISRESIDAVKNYFREEMTKTDWQLIMDLKKTFEIL